MGGTRCPKPSRRTGPGSAQATKTAQEGSASSALLATGPPPGHSRAPGAPAAPARLSHLQLLVRVLLWVFAALALLAQFLQLRLALVQRVTLAPLLRLVLLQRGLRVKDGIQTPVSRRPFPLSAQRQPARPRGQQAGAGGSAADTGRPLPRQRTAPAMKTGRHPSRAEGQGTSRELRSHAPTQPSTSGPSAPGDSAPRPPGQTGSLQAPRGGSAAASSLQKAASRGAPERPGLRGHQMSRLPPCGAQSQTGRHGEGRGDPAGWEARGS